VSSRGHEFEESSRYVRSCKSNGVLFEKVNDVYTEDDLFLIHGCIISTTYSLQVLSTFVCCNLSASFLGLVWSLAILLGGCRPSAMDCALEELQVN
jgi:hypothetical protein